MTVRLRVKPCRGNPVFSYHEASVRLSFSLEIPDVEREPTGISIDTRTLQPGDLFVALKGPREDGHVYLQDAFLKGASGAVVAKEVWQTLDRDSARSQGFHNLLIVSDTTRALQALAGWWRQQFSIPFVGVTGSVGKTSTKECLTYLLREVCGTSCVHSSRGNFNNHLGVPISLLGLEASHRIAINELGANHQGEIAALCSVVQPTAGILTMVAPVHLEGFGSLEGIYQAKTELLRALPSGAPAVIPDDDARLESLAAALPVRVVRVGTSSRAQYRLSGIREEEGWIHFRIQDHFSFSFPGIAPFLARNAGMAVAMAVELGYSLEKLPKRWEGLRLPEGRFSLRTVIPGITAIYDGYNASPESFDKALEAFSSYAGTRRKILVFADMLELGSKAEFFHRELGKKIAAQGISAALAYGDGTAYSIKEIRKLAPAVEARHFASAEDLAGYLAAFASSGDCLLFKGSRGMHTEKVLEALQSLMASASS